MNIRDACILVDNAPADEVYDYTVRLSDVKYFLDVKWKAFKNMRLYLSTV